MTMQRQRCLAVRNSFRLSFLLLLLPLIAECQIESFTRLTARAGQYQRLDYMILLKAQWETSPYCSGEVRLDLKLVSPSGTRLVVPAYFESGKSDGLSVWKVRFTPSESGEYSGAFALTNGSRSFTSSNMLFRATPSADKGFLHPGDNWVFRFDNGEAFRGVGENIGWESRSVDDSRFFKDLNESPRYHYEYLLGSLAASGGNFFRTWMCPWNLPLEWKTVGNTNRYANDKNHFNASAMQRMDQLLELSERLDVYLMLTLDSAGDFLGGDWDINNYNAKNGGPVATPLEFFTDPKAKAQYRDRLRYIIARWGYSSHIAAFEFFNEIDNLMYGLPQKIPDEVVTAWHREISDYLKSVDPYHHLITTSISHRNVAGLNQVASIDFNQRHIYGHDGKSYTGSFSDVLRHDSIEYGKPYVIGECGFEWDWSRNFDDFSAGMDSDFKKSLWLGLFSPTPILPMSWWWEYFDHRGMTTYIGHVRSIMDQMLAAGQGAFVDVACQWKGAPIKVLGIQCGAKLFILLDNGGGTTVTGNVSVALQPARKRQAWAYDPERGTTNELASLEAGIAAIPEVTLPPERCLVLIVAPLESFVK